MPSELAAPSPKAFTGSWQLEQETERSDESRLSKKRSRPSSAFSGVYGVSSGQKIGGRPRGAPGGSGSSAAARGRETATVTSRARQAASGNLRFMSANPIECVESP